MQRFYIFKRRFPISGSNNNGAVENVTLEIPSKDAIDPSWLKESDYFQDLAMSLIGQPAWTLIAARLDNILNCQEFLNRFWYATLSEKLRVFCLNRNEN